MAATPSLRDQLRAVLVALHVLAIVGTAMPAPPDFLGPDPLAAPKMAGGIRQWEKILGVDPQQFRWVVLHGGQALAGTRAQFLWFFRPYSDLAGVHQSWRMFGRSPARADRVEFWLEEEAGWRLLYTPFRADARWRAQLWEDGRVRGMIPSLEADKKGNWGRFAKAVARLAAADFPEALRLKIQRIPLKFPKPALLAESGRRTEGAAKDEVIVDLPR